METTQSAVISVEQGCKGDLGRKFSVGPDGARIGRSSKSDIVLVDESLSRHHCRVYVKPGEGLWVSDLGSANNTLLNDQPITDAKARAGDTITIGDTVLRVLHDGIQAAPPVVSTPVQPPAQPSPTPQVQPVAGTPRIDLGLGESKNPAPGVPSAKTNSARVQLYVTAAVCLILAGAAVLFKLSQIEAKRPEIKPQPKPPVNRTLELSYEKIEASHENIFRYYLELTADGKLAVQVDDLQNNEHLRKEKAKVDARTLTNLADALANTDFFTLAPEFSGIRPDVLDKWDLSITIGPKTHRSVVVNRVQPEMYKAATDLIEEFGKVELKIIPIQYSPEKRMAMAHDAYVQGRKLRDESKIRTDNIAKAIKAFGEAEWLLKGVEPKPDFFTEMITILADCKKELQKSYEDSNFNAERATRLEDWTEAAKHLRTMLELLPDDDQRVPDVRKRLLYVESKLQFR